MGPPWNRVAPALAARLPAIGFTALSTYKARRSAAGLGLAQVNCHLDILQWRPQRRFLGTAAAVALLTGHLAAKRRGAADAAEPSGILSHHQAQDAAAWDFLAELRSEEHTSELQSLMRISYAVFCLKKKKKTDQTTT